MTLTAIVVAIAVVLSSAGCLVEVEKPSTKVNVPDDRRDARLVVDGLVDTPLNWTLQQVVDAGLVDFRATFVNSVGTTVTSNFTGVRMQTLLTDAGVIATGEIVEAEASDGYRSVIFLSDISNTTFIALKEEGKWNNLSDMGAMRIVDTHMSSVYWVKKTIALHLKPSARLDLYGHITFNGSFTAGLLHRSGTTDVKWKEGTKNRTARGMSLADSLSLLETSTWEPWYIELIGPDAKRTMLNGHDAIIGGKDFLAADSKGNFVYVRDGRVLVSGLTRLGVVEGFNIYGNVTTETNLTETDLDALTQVNGTFKDQPVKGPTLRLVVDRAGLGPGATMVQVGSESKEPQNISIDNLSRYIIVRIMNPYVDSLYPVINLILVPLNQTTGIEYFPVAWVKVI